MTKPPKAQKSALPDPKVNKPGKFTETTGSSNALNGNLATSLKGNTPPKVETQDSTGTGATAENNAGTTAPLTKSELVRQKYLANREKGKNPESSITGDSSTLATNSEADKPLSSIDKIRLKYKHGISFVQNDQDEVDQQSQQEAAEEPDDTVAVRSNVGPYSEFLPEREIVVYTTSGRNDPFEPLVEDASTRAQLGQLPDVETLRLVGILQDRRMSRALFQDYNGYSYTLKTGDRVKNGFVLSIEETRVLFQIRQYGWNRQVAIDLDNEK